ncbi:MAG: hypothetical protein AB1445_00065 [Bacillota bacterium]
MVTLDLAGLLVTWLVAAPRHPHWVVVAALVQETARVALVSALGGQVTAVNAGGWSGYTVAHPTSPVLVSLAGPVLVALVGWTALDGNGVHWQELFGGRAGARGTFATTCLRVAAGSILWWLATIIGG